MGEAVMPQYSDLPKGAVPYSDLPAGATPVDDSAPQQSTGNEAQQLIDSRINTPDEGPRWLDKFGRGAAQAMLTPIAHPIQSAKGFAQAAQPDPGAAGLAEGLIGGPAGPMLAHTIKGVYDDYKQNGLSHALGNAAGGFMAGEATGGVLRRVPGVAGNVAERIGGYESPVIPKPLQNASTLAKTIRPVGGIPHAFEQDLAANMPAIRAYAAETGNPMHSQWEGATAARGLAQRGLDHFNTNFLKPNATRTVPISDIPDYQGASSEGMTSIRDINKRISDINDMTRPAGKSKTMGAEMTAQQRLGLEAEGQKLRQILYNKIGEASGVDPEQIKSMREGYGQQFGIADTIDAARRQRLGQIGANEEGATVPLDKTGILQKALTKVRGGQQYLADRNFRNAVQGFEPSPLSYPNPVPQDPALIAANRAAAEREATHQSFLDQLAQDSARSRSEATTAYRQESKKAQGEALRAKSRRNAVARDNQ